MTKVTGEARMDTGFSAEAGAKVGAKGEAHFNLLGPDDVEAAEEAPAQMWPPPARRMAIPKKRRHR